jgi:diguanylate cyclase (GGDEF)-like protein/PAS domain S-box-containing protein
MTLLQAGSTTDPPLPPGWRDRRVLLLAAAIAGVFVLGLPGQRQAPLLPYLWLPALLASAFATPAQVTALNLVALGCSVASIVRGQHSAAAADWVHLLVLAGVGLLAIPFSQRRQRSKRQLQAEWQHVRLLAENAADVVFRIDRHGQLEWISSSIETLLGWAAAELVGRPILSLIHGDDSEQVQNSWLTSHSHSHSHSQRMLYRIVDRQGTSHWVAASCRAISDERGQLAGHIGSWSDAHDDVEERQRLIEQRQLLETVLNNVDSYIYMKDVEHRYLYANHRMQQLLGRNLDAIVGCSDRAFFAGEVLETMWRFDEDVLHCEHPLQREEVVPSTTGEPRWFLSNKLKLWQNGQTCLIGFSTDITAHKLAEQELERSESKFHLLFEASLDAIAILRPDPEGHFIDANTAVLKIYGARDKESFLRCTPAAFSPELQENGERSADLIPFHIAQALAQGSHQFEWLHRRLDNGALFLGLVTLKAIRLNDQPALLSVVRDISESRRNEEHLRQLAYRDALTGLPNRAASLEHLEQRLSDPASRTTATPLVLVNLDFDHFQAVNDSFGLEVGNRVLTTAAAVLRQWLHPDDWVARLESDEFLIIHPLADADRATAQRFGHDLQQALAAGLNSHDDLPIHPSISVGLSLWPDHGLGPVPLLQAANTALMESKRRGKGWVCAYSPQLSRTIQRRLDMETKLEQALERNQLSLLFQPAVDQSGQLVGAEALLRWTLADGRMVSPDVFIPLAEQTGLIHPIGEWVIETACAQLAEWRRQGLRLPRLALNISAVQFEHRQTDLDAWLMAAIARHGISPVQLELEVTETALLRYPDVAGALLYQLGAAGFRIAIDDFGTGYSSLMNLHTLPVHKLKIDKSFVQHVTDSSTSQAIIDSTLIIARKLKLETIAEGVETTEQWQALKQLGCDSFQGYLFGRPMLAKDLATMLRRPRAKNGQGREE